MAGWLARLSTCPLPAARAPGPAPASCPLTHSTLSAPWPADRPDPAQGPAWQAVHPQERHGRHPHHLLRPDRHQGGALRSPPRHSAGRRSSLPPACVHQLAVARPARPPLVPISPPMQQHMTPNTHNTTTCPLLCRCLLLTWWRASPSSTSSRVCSFLSRSHPCHPQHPPSHVPHLPLFFLRPHFISFLTPR